MVKAERNAAGATNINRDVVDVLVTPVAGGLTEVCNGR
nr:Mu-like prophage major head subunit gpT family protein [Pseudomonas aeruginosa]